MKRFDSIRVRPLRVWAQALSLLFLIQAFPLTSYAGEEILLAQSKGNRQVAKKHFDKGTSFFEEGNSKAALEEFLNAYESSPHPMVLVNIANCYARLMEPVKAVEYFERFLNEATMASEEQLAAARDELAKQKKLVGRLRIRNAPEESTIIVDGEKKGTAPFEDAILVKVGPHVVLARTKEGDEIEKVVEVPTGGEATVSFGETKEEAAAPPPAAAPIEPAPAEAAPPKEPEPPAQGEIKVDASVQGSKVILDGKEVGTAPWTQKTDIGEYTLRIENEGYLPWEGKVDVVRGMTQTVDVTLAQSGQEPDRLWFWVSIGATGALLGTSVGLGIASAYYDSSAGNYKDWLNSHHYDTKELGTVCNKTKVPKGYPTACENDFLRKDYDIKASNFMIAAIVAGGLTLVGGGLAAYFWFFPPGEPKSTANVWLAPVVEESRAGISVFGRF